MAPNQHRAEQLVGQELFDPEDFVMALDAIRLGARDVLVTLEDGGFALVRGEPPRPPYRAVVPRLEPVSGVGAGDRVPRAVAHVPARRRRSEGGRSAWRRPEPSVLDVGAGRFDAAEARRLAAAVEVHELEAVSS